MSHLMQMVARQEAARKAQQTVDPRIAARPYFHMSTDELVEAIELKRNADIRRDLIAELYARERR